MWYHVSKRFLGNEFVFKPKLPETAVIEREGDTPRICVSDSIAKCLRAIDSGDNLTLKSIIINFSDLKDEFSFETEEDLYAKNFRTPAIYVTEETPILPPDISDFRFNNEHWFLQPTKFKFVGYLSFNALLKGQLSISPRYDYVEIEDYRVLENKEFVIK